MLPFGSVLMCPHILTFITTRIAILGIKLKKKICAAKGCTDSLAALKARPYICMSVRLRTSHINAQNLEFFPTKLAALIAVYDGE